MECFTVQQGTIIIEKKELENEDIMKNKEYSKECQCSYFHDQVLKIYVHNWGGFKVPMKWNFIILFEQAFKMIKNGVYFIVIALLVAELFKILIYAN